MTDRLLTPVIRKCAGVVFALSIIFQASAAYSAQIKLEYFLGFNGTFHLGDWTPLSIKLQNTGPAALGVLEIETVSGSEYRRDVRSILYQVEADLPTDSIKIFNFTIFIKSFTHPLTIRFKQNGEILVSRSLNLRKHYTEKKLVLSLGQRAGPDLLSGLPEGYQAAAIQPRYLPKTWYGYGGVTMVMVHPSAWPLMENDQFEALMAWIDRGGLLVTSAGQNYGAVLTPRLKKLLPLKISGFIKVDDLEPLEAFGGGRLSGVGSLAAVKADFSDAQKLVDYQGHGLVFKKDVGDGRVIFLAFDYLKPPISMAAGRHAFFNRILTFKRDVLPENYYLQETDVFSSLLSSMPAGFPPVILLAVLLVAHMALMQAVFIRLKKAEVIKFELIWLILGSTAVFSAAIYFLFHFSNISLDPGYSSFIYLKKNPGQIQTSARYQAGLFSLRAQNGEVGFGRRSLPVMLEQFDDDRQNDMAAMVFKHSSGKRTVAFHSSKWSKRYFTIETRIDFPITGRAVREGDGLRLEIANLTRHDLFESRVYYSGRLLYFGDIAAGAKITRRLSSAAINNQEMFSDYMVNLMLRQRVPLPSPFLDSMFKTHIEPLLTGITKRLGQTKDKLVFFGWLGSDPLDVSIKTPGFVKQDAGFLEWEMLVEDGA